MNGLIIYEIVVINLNLIFNEYQIYIINKYSSFVEINRGFNQQNKEKYQVNLKNILFSEIDKTQGNFAPKQVDIFNFNSYFEIVKQTGQLKVDGKFE